MQALPTLPSVLKLSSVVTRILGQNPGQFTLQGTNTYLIGHASSLLLLDTGEGIPTYVPLLKEALESYGEKARVRDIVLTHYHHDHVGGLAGVLDLIQNMKLGGERGPRVWKYPCPAQDVAVDTTLAEAAAGSYTRSEAGTAVHQLEHDQLLPLSDGLSLQVIHTPGHTTDSVSLLLRSTSESITPSLFTADTVLGHSTAVFEDLSAYMISLSRCITLLEPIDTNVALYCGHGDVVEDGVGKLKEYVRHRMEREGQAVEALRAVSAKTENDSRGTTAEALTRGIYGTTIPESLVPAATRGILLHLNKLLDENKVDRIKNDGNEGKVEYLVGWNDYWSISTARASNPGSL